MYIEHTYKQAMKYFFFVVILIIDLVSGLLGDVTHSDHHHHLFDPHYIDDHSSTNLVKPCSVHDLHCIRNFFTKTTGCSPSYGKPYDPILKTLELDIPHSNVSIVIYNVLLSGLSKGKINTFLYNKRSDSLVFEVVFDSLKMITPKAVVTYYRKGKEPLYSSDFGDIEFNDLSLTLNVQNLHDVNYVRSHVHAHVSDPYPHMAVGPGLQHEIKGHTATTHWSRIDLLGLSVQEGMIKEGPAYMQLFLKMNICDFNLYKI